MLRNLVGGSSPRPDEPQPGDAVRRFLFESPPAEQNERRIPRHRDAEREAALRFVRRLKVSTR